MAGNRGRVMIVIAMAGFLGGILYTNLAAGDYVAAMGIFHEYFLKQYAQADLAEPSYFWYLVRVRAAPLAGLLLLRAAGICKAAAVIFLIWTGFLCGMIFTSAALKLGVKGILLCLAAMLPHMVFYLFGYALVLFGLYHYPRISWNFQKTMLVFLAICMGIALEYYMNPILVKMFLKMV